MQVSYLGSSESSAFIAKSSIRIPLYSHSFEEPSDLSHNREVRVNNPATTFFVRAQGDFVRLHSDVMEEGNIFSGDVLVIDRSLTARDGDTVIARQQGKMEIVTLQLDPDVLVRPKNKAYSTAAVTMPTRGVSNLEAPTLAGQSLKAPNVKEQNVKEQKVEVFGVVTSVVRQKE